MKFTYHLFTSILVVIFAYLTSACTSEKDKSLNREDEVKKFVYNTYYYSELLDYNSESLEASSYITPLYSYDLLVKFLKNGITEDLDYPVNEKLSKDNLYYKTFYSDDFNRMLQELDIIDSKVDDSIIGFDYDIFSESQEGFFNLKVDILDVKFKSSTQAEVTLLQNNLERIFYLVKEHGVWKIDNMDNYKEEAKERIKEYQ